jgi:hypothetical protein
VSKAADVSSAIAAALEAMNLTGVTVARRKTPAVPEGATLPQAVVSVGEEGDVERLTATEVMLTYPVSVTFVTKAGRKLDDDDTLRDWREETRKAVEAAATWAGVAGFNVVRAGGREPFDRAALAKDLNFSSLVYRVEVIEDRT